MKQKNSLFSTDYTMAFTTSLLLRLVMQFKITLIPIYMLSLGMTKVQAGLAMTVFTLFALIFRPLSGNLIEKTGRKPMLFIGIILFIITTIPFGFFRNIYFLYLLQALSGLSFSVQSIALSTMVTDIVPENKLTSGLGYFGLTASVAQAIGPFLAAWSVGLYGYPVLFLCAGVFMSFSIVSLNFVTYETKETVDTDTPEAEESKPTRQPKFLDKIIERSALLPAAFIGCLALTSAATTSFLVPYAQSEGINGIGAYFAARAVGIAISRIFTGRLVDKLGSRTMLGIGIIGVLIGIGGLSIFRQLIPLIAIAFIYGLGFGFAHVLLNVEAVRKTPKNRRAFANATFYLAMDAGIGLGSVVWGGIGDYFGMGKIFVAAALFTFMVLVWFSFSKILKVK